MFDYQLFDINTPLKHLYLQSRFAFYVVTSTPLNYYVGSIC